MNRKSFIETIKRDFINLKNNGITEVKTINLIHYIEEMTSEEQRSEIDEEIVHRNALAKFEFDAQHAIEMFRAVIDAGKEALRAAMIINGGAVIALLSLLGNLGIIEIKTLGGEITLSILYFSFGVLLVAIAYGARYCAQYSYSREWIKPGHFFNIISIFSTLTSYILFAWGSYLTYLTFNNHLP